MRSFITSIAVKVWPQRGRHHRVVEAVTAAVVVGTFLPHHPCFSVAAVALVAVVALPAISTAVEAAGFRRMARTVR